MSYIRWSPLPHQREAFFSKSPYVGLIAGYGSGKTTWLIYHMLMLASENAPHDGGLLCPDLKMFKRDCLPIIDKIRNENNLRVKYNRQDSCLIIDETKSKIWIFHDEDKGESIKGPNLAFMCINEATIISKPGFDAAIARVRIKEAKLPQVVWCGTPEGFNHIYKEFIEKQRNDAKIIFAKTTDNPYIHESYVERLKASYDELLLKAYVEGQFVNLTGKPAAYAFDRKKHVKQCPYQWGKYQVWVSVDFNINPMSATLFYRVTDNPSGVLLWAFDSIKLRSADTHDLAKAIKEKVGTNCILYPDPAGISRSTRNINVTDISILESYGFKEIRFKRKISSVRDCLNSLNSLLSKNAIMFDPKASDAIIDLEQCQLKDNGEIDKSDPARTHWLDGIKNMVDYEFPIIKPKSNEYIQL
ncbi:MAG: terminase family protein [Candidatus Aenigmatarchaeota archaeon]